MPAEDEKCIYSSPFVLFHFINCLPSQLFCWVDSILIFFYRINLELWFAFFVHGNCSENKYLRSLSSPQSTILWKLNLPAVPCTSILSGKNGPTRYQRTKDSATTKPNSDLWWRGSWQWPCKLRKQERQTLISSSLRNQQYLVDFFIVATPERMQGYVFIWTKINNMEIGAQDRIWFLSQSKCE